MAGVAKERIRDWMRRRFPSRLAIAVYECADVTQLLPPGDPTYGLIFREGMLFASRDLPIPAPRWELVVLTSVLANYSVERIVTALEALAVPALTARPHLRVLIDDSLQLCDWGPSSTGDTIAELKPCDIPGATTV